MTDDTELLEIEIPGDGADKGQHDDPVADLKDQVASLQRKASDEEARRQRAEADAARARHEAEQARGQVAETQADAIGNAIAAEKQTLASAKKDYASAMSEGDYEKAAEAQERLSTAAAKLVDLEKENDRAETRKAEQPSRASEDPVEDYIGQFPPRSQAWLREHRDYVTDGKKNLRMLAAHHEAIADDLVRDSDAYFAYIEKRLGLRQGDDVEVTDPPPKPAPRQEPRRAAAPHAAPVSRDPPSGSGRQNSRTLTLTRAQAETADALGMSRAEYATHLRDLQQEGRLGQQQR